VVVTGQDAEPEAFARLRHGTQAMTVQKDISKLVHATLDAISGLAAGRNDANFARFHFEKYTVPAILLEPEIVTGSLEDAHR
jgi:ABC-type xylose transport system substrate-binding protein